jgi:hypothetical protein
MFDKITKYSLAELQRQIDSLEELCDNDPAVAELMKYILAYSEQELAGEQSFDSKVGGEIVQQIYHISNYYVLSGLGNPYGFCLDWPYLLNHFIGNYFYDDSAFAFDQNKRGVFTFRSATDDDRFLQNPLIIVEAAKANTRYYIEADAIRSPAAYWDAYNALHVDSSAVFALLKIPVDKDINI